jgi:anti-sigma factor RsiW
MRCDEARVRLDSLHDDELTPEESAAVGAHIAECAACSQAYEALRKTSHQLQEGLVHYPAPDVLKARIHGALMQQDARDARLTSAGPRWLRLAAAGLVIAIARSAGTYIAMRPHAASQSLANDVLTSHIRSLMPNHLIDVASNDQHNVKPWFNGRMDLSPQVPALDSSGFMLAGGRLDFLAGHPAAVVVYMRRQHVINMYSWPEPGPDAPETASTANGYHLVRWRRAGVAYWAVSDLNSAELSQFVTLFDRRASQ